jgi:ubiquitin carboxyl-terminal hydrolase 25
MEEPVQAKQHFNNSIYDNFFGSHTTITKLINKET